MAALICFLLSLRSSIFKSKSRLEAENAALRQQLIVLQPLHSITSSASASTVGGMSRPSALAVFRLIASSNLVGCTTGRSAGFSLQDSAGINADLAIAVSKARSVTHQAAGGYGFAPRVDCGNRVACRQRNELITPAQTPDRLAFCRKRPSQLIFG